MENQKEILKALETIKNVCKSHDCFSCPLAEQSSCGIQNEVPPQDWRIKPDEPWRAFED